MKIIKQLFTYNIAFLIAFIGVYYSQSYILKSTQITLGFDHWDTNVFFAVASLLICIHLFLFTYLEALKNLLGFIYLPTIIIKGLLFYFSFQHTIFGLETFTTAERFHLLIPSLLYLIIEVFFVAKLLDKMPK